MSAALDLGCAPARCVAAPTHVGAAACGHDLTAVTVAVVGELDAEAWAQVDERLYVAAADSAPTVVLDLTGCPHARPIPVRADGYLMALAQRGADVVIRCSPYVQACIQASRWGCELAVRWEVA